MGIRLTLKHIVILAIFFITGCKPTEQTSYDEAEWVWAYKSQVVYSCMCELTNEELKEVLKHNNDISFIGEADVLGVYYTAESDSVGRSFAKRITPVFSDDSEFAGRKSIFTSCLALYNNKEVNDLILERYKTYKKHSDI